MPARVPPSVLAQLEARRICIVKPSALGDVVQALPLLPVLRERFPAARIAWVIDSALAELLEGHPHLHEAIPFQRRGSYRESLRLLSRLRAERFDLVFDLQGLLRTAVMTWATRAPVRVGLETAREGARLACNCTLPDSSRLVPAHARYWRVAEALGLGELRAETVVAMGQEDRVWAARLVRQTGRPVLAVHPGARWATKRYPVEKLAAVVSRAARLYDLAVLILGSPAETKLGQHLQQLLRRFLPAMRVCNLTGQTSLKQLAALLAEASLVISNDSGPMHLAAGLGTPVVGLFTCTSPVLSGPPGSQHELVSTRLPCAASYSKRCPYAGRAHMACMEELHVERVWEATVRAVEKNRRIVRAA